MERIWYENYGAQRYKHSPLGATQEWHNLWLLVGKSIQGQLKRLAAEADRPYIQVPTLAAEAIRPSIQLAAEAIRPSIQVPTVAAEAVRPSIQVPTLAAEAVRPSVQVPTLAAEAIRPSIQVPTLAAEALRAKHSPEEGIQKWSMLLLLAENPERISQFCPILPEHVDAEAIRHSIEVLTLVAEAIPPSIQDTLGTISSELDKMNKKETTEKYTRVKHLKCGAFGEVWLIVNNVTKEHFAMKCFERGRKFKKYMAREIIIQKSLCHPNVIQFKEVVLSSYLGIVLEYAKGGDLNEKIFNSSQKGLDENMARYYFQQLISGVSYLHSKKDICHRDLKPANILLDGSDPPCLKICDFGYSKSGQLHSKPKSLVGTPEYMAPEVQDREYNGNREYNGELADVWSCGMILYNMLVGERLIQETNACPFPLPDSLSPDSKDLLARMLVKDPGKRITIEDVKKHQWLELPEATQVTKENPRLFLQSDEEIEKIVEEAEYEEEEEDGI